MEKQSLYNFNFGLVCLSSLLFSASFNMLIPELPAYLKSLGGEQYLGLIIALFTLSAGVSRPFCGKLIDNIGRKPAMLIGILVCIICGFLYPILTTVYGFLMLRLFHGFSTGFSPTAYSAYITDIVSSTRWGEALGVQSLFFSSGLALGPTLGSYISQYFSHNILFYGSSVVSFLAILCISSLKETLGTRKSFRISLLNLKWNEVIDLKVIYPAVITLISFLSFGIVLTIISIWSEHLGIENKGLYFIIFSLSSLFIRAISGKLSDKFSREIIVIIGLIFLFISFTILAYYPIEIGLITSAIIYGFSMGMLSPTLNAWTVDLSNPSEKGKAIATMFIALEIGIGLGACISGWLYQGNITNIPIIFYSYTFIVFISFLFMIYQFYTNKAIVKLSR